MSILFTGNQKDSKRADENFEDRLDLKNPVIADFSEWFKLNDLDTSFSP